MPNNELQTSGRILTSPRWNLIEFSASYVKNGFNFVKIARIVHTPGCSTVRSAKLDSTSLCFTLSNKGLFIFLRSFRRTQKAVEMADLRIRKHPLPPPPVHYEEDELVSDREVVHTRTTTVARASEEVESEEGAESTAEDERERKTQVKARVDQRQFPPPPSFRHSYSISRHEPLYHSQQQQHHPHHYKSRSAPTVYESPTTGHRYAGGSMSQAISPHRNDHRNPHLGRPLPHSIAYSPARYPHSSRPANGRRPSLDHEMDSDADGEADMDADGDAEVDDEGQSKRGLRSPPIISGSNSSRHINSSRPIPRRLLGLADLDSSAGR